MSSPATVNKEIILLKQNTYKKIAATVTQHTTWTIEHICYKLKHYTSFIDNRPDLILPLFTKNFKPCRFKSSPFRHQQIYSHLTKERQATTLFHKMVPLKNYNSQIWRQELKHSMCSMHIANICKTNEFKLLQQINNVIFWIWFQLMLTSRLVNTKHSAAISI